MTPLFLTFSPSASSNTGYGLNFLLMNYKSLKDGFGSEAMIKFNSNFDLIFVDFFCDNEILLDTVSHQVLRKILFIFMSCVLLPGAVALIFDMILTFGLRSDRECFYQNSFCDFTVKIIFGILIKLVRKFHAHVAHELCIC